MCIKDRYGGLSPHHPFHELSGHAPRTGPNMLRPRIKAPKFAIPRAANSSSTSMDPPSCPCIARNVFVWKNHWKISGPRLPSGSFRLCSVPALKPSNDTANPATRTLGIFALLQLHAIAPSDNVTRSSEVSHLRSCLIRLIIAGYFWRPCGISSATRSNELLVQRRLPVGAEEQAREAPPSHQGQRRTAWQGHR